jgi:hypothetical protein
MSLDAHWDAAIPPGRIVTSVERALVAAEV